MRAMLKVSLVAAGYVGAVFVASAIVLTNVALTSGPDRQASSGMNAFGDLLLFLAVFGVSAIPPTGAALFFLRPYRLFWQALCVTALAIAATGLAAVITYLGAQTLAAGPVLHSWSSLAVLRILASPLFALAFGLCGLLAPSRTPRIALIVATLAEVAVFVYVAVAWFYASRSH